MGMASGCLLRRWRRRAVGRGDGHSSVVAPVEVTDEIARSVVCLPHGWGHDAPGTRLNVASRRPGVNTNILTDGSIVDPLSGNAVLNGIPVEVVPAPATQ